ncbi:MAG: hypothetical protein ACYDGM_09700 [Vulcanimicrobiaceae bacterium]
MYKSIFAAVALALALAAPIGVPAAQAAGTSATPVPSELGTPPPEIGRVVSRPVCAALRKRIAPSIARMLQNDRTISKSPPLFTQFNYEIDDATSESIDNNASKNMLLMHMEQLVPSLANNIIDIKKLLEDPNYIPAYAATTSDAKLMEQIRQKLLSALAGQELALDIINGFVTTQQLGDMQHEGMGYINAITNGGSTSQEQAMKAQPTADPMLHDPNAAGLPADPYTIDPAAVPGLSVGYNPVTRLLGALQWSRRETASRENVAAKDIVHAVALCGGNPSATPPAPTPTPSPSH